MREDPSHDVTGQSSIILKRQLQGCKDEDPNEDHHTALPLIVFKEISKDRSSHKQVVIGQLIVGAFFFTMRSCEYIKTRKSGKNRKRIVENVQFYKGRIKLNRSANIHSASHVSIIFIFQKNKNKYQTVSHKRSGKKLCPVKVWADIVTRILSYEDTNELTPINIALINGKLVEIKDKDVTLTLKATVDNLGQDRLGFNSRKMDTHSVRSSSAMALFLIHILVPIIKLIGRWQSAGFINYIREQVLGLLNGVSSLKVNQKDFFTTSTEISAEYIQSLTKQLNHSTHSSQSFTNPHSCNGQEATSDHSIQTYSCFNV